MKKWISILFLWMSYTCYSQEIPEEWKEGWGDENLERKLEDLYALIQEPLDLNKVSRDELMSLSFLNVRQVEDILIHREKYGHFLSIYELQVIPSLSLDVLRKLAPIVKVSSNLAAGGSESHFLLYRTDFTLEKSKGFLEDEFGGDRLRQHLRYKWVNRDRFSLAFLMEKDPGEKNLFDHYLITLQWKNLGPLKQVILGNYSFQWGQGLISSGGFSLGKGSEPVLGVKKGDLGLRPFQSLSEDLGFRGVALNSEFKNMELSFFYSHQFRDANLDGENFTSLLTSGLHRTENEIGKKDNVKEQVWGTSIKRRIKKATLGMAYMETHFDKVFRKRDALYNYFSFQGKHHQILSLQGNYGGANYTLFSEIAYSEALAGVVGLSTTIGRELDVSLVYRNYPARFTTLFGDAFSENSTPINERGQFLGWKYRFRRHWELQGHYDLYQFPWLKFGISHPSEGRDYSLKLWYKPIKTLTLKAQWREKYGLSKGAGLRVDWIFFKDWKVQSQWTWRAVSGDGWAWANDFEGSTGQWKWKLRCAYLHAPSYENRVYIYENDVLYATSFPAYYGEGIRYYVLVKRPLLKNMDVWIKFAQSRLDRNLGSGWDELPSTVKSDFRIQLKYSF